MTIPAAPARDSQPSLLTAAETEAIRPGSTRPWNPAAARGHLTGLGDGKWHAVPRDNARFARRRTEASQRPLEAIAACRAVAGVIASRGTYDRLHPAVARRPCRVCAWRLAIETGSTGRELALITPARAEAAAIARSGADPGLAVRVCQAVLASASGSGDEDGDFPGGLDSPAVTQLLALATRHRPVLYVTEACAEGDCGTCPPAGEPGPAPCTFDDAEARVQRLHPARRPVGGGVGGQPAARAHCPCSVQRPDRPRSPLPHRRPLAHRAAASRTPSCK